MSDRQALQELLARWIAAREEGTAPADPAAVAPERPDLAADLRRLAAALEEAESGLDMAVEPEAPMPAFPGYRTVERLGRGGGGEVYKLLDLELGRAVAAKVIRSGGALRSDLHDFLREARTLALFEDPRIVRILEFRGQADPPVLFMEYVDGFALDEIAPSLEFRQRARLLAEIAEALHRAHGLGIQHRDLKPANILVDARLQPKILDFGLSRGEPDVGHGVGTPAFMAPELLDPARPPIDARADVYSLGVLLYQALCGALPWRAEPLPALLEEIRAGEPRLPAEVDPSVPEPLQAIALKAMERRPEDRYATALEMARDLRRYLDGAPVLARPALYQSALGRRIQAHLDQVREWVRLQLVHPHEAERIRKSYRALEATEDDWFLRSRALTMGPIALYLGAFLALCGGLLYLVAYWNDAVDGAAGPLLFLGVPCATLAGVGERLFRSDRRAVAVAFFLAAVALLPLALLVFLQVAGIAPVDTEDPAQLLGWIGSSAPSNRQLQGSGLASVLLSAVLAARTRTRTLAGCAVVLGLLTHLALAGDFGLREQVEEGRWDLVALRLLPALVLAALAGWAAERRARTWFSGPLYVAGAFLLVVVAELAALDGRAFRHLGLSMAPFQPEGVSDPTLLDTVAAMSLAGVLFHLVAWLLESRGTAGMQAVSGLLYAITPFAVLEPLALLNETAEYSIRYAWLYLGLSLAIALLSRVRQRKSFYFAGLLNTAVALGFVTHLKGWWDDPEWAVTVIAAGLAALAAGHALSGRRRRR